LNVTDTRRGLLIVVSGPAGVGKDAALKRLRRHMPDLHFIVTATTRPKRRNEVEGHDYFFVSNELFEDMIARGELLEHAIVHNKYHYGVPKDEVRKALAKGHDAIMRIDVQGAATIRAIAPQTVFIFLRPGSMKELERRLLHRKSETAEEMAARLANAPHEMAEMPKFEYTVVNSDGHLKDTVEEIAAIICAEHCRTHSREIIL
jgi:guanylate kinase